MVRRRESRPVRHLPAVVSVSIMATAWAHQEDAPHGAVVVAGYEVRGVDRLGRPWSAPPESTLAMAVVLRPSLPAVHAGSLWLAGALAVLDSFGTPLVPWWPDTVVDTASQPVATLTVGAEVDGGRLALAVLTVRVDLSRAGVLRADAARVPGATEVPGAAQLPAAARALGTGEPTVVDRLAVALVEQAERRTDELCAGAAARRELAEAYSATCPLVGNQARVRLLPSGEARGTVEAIDAGGHLVLTSHSGMVERFTVDMVAAVELRSSLRCRGASRHGQHL